MSNSLALKTRPETQFGEQTAEFWFHDLSTKYVLAQIYFSLNQVKVFSRLQEKPSTVKELVTELGLESKSLETLLDYVCGVDDVIEKRSDGKYSLTEFGVSIVHRYRNSVDNTINLFDVRVGCYGPVWSSLTGLVNGSKVYGSHFERNGEFADNGVEKLSGHFWPALKAHFDCNKPDMAVEVGLSSALLEATSESLPQIKLGGIDRKQQARDRKVDKLAGAIDKDYFAVADFLELDNWINKYPTDKAITFFSLHFHEIVAVGKNKLIEALTVIAKDKPNWNFVFFEQPYPDSQQSRDDVVNKYSHSNVLIHHLIGNGKILSEQDWLDIGRKSGYANVMSSTTGYLGYRCFLYGS